MNPPLKLGYDESHKIGEFMAWRALERRGAGDAVRRVAAEMFELAAGELISDWHVAALVRRHTDRFASAAVVQAIREIADDMCRWQAMRQARRTTPTGARVVPRAPALPRLDVELDVAGDVAARRPSRPAPSFYPLAPSIRPAVVSGPATLPPALAHKPKSRALRWLAFVTFAALAVGAYFGVTYVLRDRARPVEGHFASAHLGVEMDLDEAWSYAYDRDRKEVKGDWQRRASVFFRGVSAAYFDAELIVVSLAKKNGALISDDEVRTVGAAETVGIAAADRECVSWRLRKSGSICVSLMRQGSRTYNAREYTFRSGQRIVYVLVMHEVHRPKNTGDVDGVEKQNGREITEANAIAESIEALADKPAP